MSVLFPQTRVFEFQVVPISMPNVETYIVVYETKSVDTSNSNEIESQKSKVWMKNKIQDTNDITPSVHLQSTPQYFNRFFVFFSSFRKIDLPEIVKAVCRQMI